MSLAKIAEVAREREVDLIIIAGDLFDAPISNSAMRARMPKLLDACGALLDAAPVVSVQGTPSHDAPGCYAPLLTNWLAHEWSWHHFDSSERRACAIILVIDAASAEPGVELVDLAEIGGASIHARSNWSASSRGLPEPSRGWLSARGEAQGRAETGEAVVDGLRLILAGIGAATHGRTVPHIHVQHGEVRGATLASGQVLPPGGIAVGTEDLALTGADYIALGHIHKGQQLNPDDEYGRIVYSGSAYPVDWGERDEKLLRVVTLGEDGYPDAEHVPYGHPARIKCDVGVPADRDRAPPRDGLIMIENWVAFGAGVEGDDLWLAYHVPADFSQSEEADIRNRAERLDGIANSVRVTIERAPRERVRVPNIHSIGRLA